VLLGTSIVRDQYPKNRQRKYPVYLNTLIHEGSFWPESDMIQCSQLWLSGYKIEAWGDRLEAPDTETGILRLVSGVVSHR